MRKKRIKTHHVHKPFTATAGQWNWDVEEHGKIGIGIPCGFLRSIGAYDRFRIEVEESSIYEVNKKTVMMHEERWNTMKTMPGEVGTMSRWVIIPLGICKFIGLTKESEKRTSKIFKNRFSTPEEPIQSSFQFA